MKPRGVTRAYGMGRLVVPVLCCLAWPLSAAFLHAIGDSEFLLFFLLIPTLVARVMIHGLGGIIAARLATRSMRGEGMTRAAAACWALAAANAAFAFMAIWRWFG